MPEVIHDPSAAMEYLNNLGNQIHNLENQIHNLQRLLAMPTTNSPQTGQHAIHHIVKTIDILNGEPVITGTRTPVRAIVEYWKFGDTPEEIARKLPHLRLAHIFAALSYYDDHRDEIEHYIRLNQVPVND